MRDFTRGLNIIGLLLFMFCEDVCAAPNLAALTPLPIWVDVFIVDDLSLNKKQQIMNSWVDTQDIRNAVLPEINRIWAPAAVYFEVRYVAAIASHPHPQKTALLEAIVRSKRDASGHSDPERIRKYNKLLNYHIAETLPAHGVMDYSGESVISVFLVPYLGETSQGNAKRKKRRIIVGQWTDKPSKGALPAQRLPLIEAQPMNVGSIARTMAHELGHILGLAHPDKKRQTQFGLLMGGRRAGYDLTQQEILMARQAASQLNAR